MVDASNAPCGVLIAFGAAGVTRKTLVRSRVEVSVRLAQYIIFCEARYGVRRARLAFARSLVQSPPNDAGGALVAFFIKG